MAISKVALIQARAVVAQIETLIRKRQDERAIRVRVLDAQIKAGDYRERTTRAQIAGIDAEITRLHAEVARAMDKIHADNTSRETARRARDERDARAAAGLDKIAEVG